MKIIKFLILAFLVLENICSESQSNASTQNSVPPEQNLKVVIQRVKIPLVFDRDINMLVFDVEFYFETIAEKKLVENNINYFIDVIICDTFDSARLLLDEQTKLSKSNAEKIRKRIWVQCAKKLHQINKFARIKHLKLTKISYMTRQKEL